MINFISYDKDNEMKILYQCESLWEMLSREVRGEVIIHRPSGMDITNLCKDWVEEIMPILWDVEVFENSLNTYVKNDTNEK